jgi:hypothetical protein
LLPYQPRYTELDFYDCDAKQQDACVAPCRWAKTKNTCINSKLFPIPGVTAVLDDDDETVTDDDGNDVDMLGDALDDDGDDDEDTETLSVSWEGKYDQREVSHLEESSEDEVEVIETHRVASVMSNPELAIHRAAGLSGLLRVLVGGSGGGALMLTPQSSQNYLTSLVKLHTAEQFREQVVMVRVGCGSGNEALAIASAVEARVLILIELEPQNLYIARLVLQKHRAALRVKQVVFVLADFTLLPLDFVPRIAVMCQVSAPRFAFFSITVAGVLFARRLRAVAERCGCGTSLSMWCQKMWENAAFDPRAWRLHEQFPTMLCESGSKWLMQLREHTWAGGVCVEAVAGAVVDKKQIHASDMCRCHLHTWSRGEVHTRCANPFQDCPRSLAVRSEEMRQQLFEREGGTYRALLATMPSPLAGLEATVFDAMGHVYPVFASGRGTRNK